MVKSTCVSVQHGCHDYQSGLLHRKSQEYFALLSFDFEKKTYKSPAIFLTVVDCLLHGRTEITNAHITFTSAGCRSIKRAEEGAD